MSTSPSSNLNELTTVPLDKIEPYWRNPRRITDQAVNAVADSIKRYGYLQPIVVDEKYVIIIGHTRYAALRRLGYTEAAVAVERTLTPKQVQQLRVVDNRVAEFSTWDFEKLIEEVDSLNPEALRAYFPELIAEQFDAVDDADFEKQFEVEEEEKPAQNAAEFICPSCFHGWSSVVTEAEIMSGMIGDKS